MNVATPLSPPNTLDVRSHARSVSDAVPSPARSASVAAATPAPPQDRRPKKSSSTCATCRHRKVRCNGARPICSNCQRLGFPCSYDEADADAWHVALPRRRVKQACLTCHSRKARCSGHLPSCERCTLLNLDCVYRPTKRVKTPSRPPGASLRSPATRSIDSDSHDAREDSDRAMSDPASTPASYGHDGPSPDESFDSLIRRTFDKFFHHIHHIPVFSFLHRASLMEQYYVGKVDKALLLALVGITSCLTSMGPGIREYGDGCIDEAESLIFADYTVPSTIKVQALVLIIKHRILCNKFPSAFMLFSIASRFAAALRLNHHSPNLCFLAQESRRRLMWSLYCIDAGISGGFAEFSLWRADRINVGLPCNERNFEFDLSKPTEKLVPGPDDPDQPRSEDIGSLALHVRILHIKQKIVEFTKTALIGRNINAVELQTRVLGLHQELEDFAYRMPASFQFSENSMRLRAYSPRICVFVMIHIFLRQCYCDLYRLAMTGFRDALPLETLESLDQSFLDHCQRQCVENSVAMADIFKCMDKLHARPIADLDLAICAFQCARTLHYAYRLDAVRFGLAMESLREHSQSCLKVIQQCCRGPAAAGVQADLERLINSGLGAVDTSSPVLEAQNGLHGRTAYPQHPVLKNIRVGEEPSVIHTPARLSAGPGTRPDVYSSPGMTTLSPTMLPDAWMAPTTQKAFEPSMNANGDDGDAAGLMSTELNNAYEGALEGLGLANGLDHAMGVMDLSTLWAPTAEWMAPEFANGAGI
ncbi:Fungal transcriptional regulatory protein [Beauveria brongniartii RCEF 3172]|uniref:Fungal transcriptional regulatory protein n=1 Tax=Beauveria brongniartii RCEF 3172 TaxID=1081107 RepID=A0A167A3R9_9HYPO|nr:Fungal transcriptional regulatory protein [Beauveria brongniartii RCEF 3172]